MMATSQLMSEDDVRQYFLQNNGVVRNTDIVTYFRSYLSDPNIRDEARALFKSYVNKLANVKTENGEKFLVLKSQYIHPIDGSGIACQITHSNHFDTGAPYSNYVSSRALGPGIEDPSLISTHLPLQASYSYSSQPHPMLKSRLHNADYSLHANNNFNSPFLYGNQISSNQTVHASTVHPAQTIPSVIPPSSEYLLEYGLPPTPLAPPTNIAFPPPPPAHNSITMSTGRLPPPYRPPPPAARFSKVGSNGNSTSSLSQYNNAPIRAPENYQTRYESPSQHFSSEPSTPRRSQSQYRFHRSSSVTGGLTQEEPKYFDSPPPPVPPRSKKGSCEKLSRTRSMSVMDDFERIRVSGMERPAYKEVNQFSDNYAATGPINSSGSGHLNSHQKDIGLTSELSESNRLNIYENNATGENVDCSENEKENVNVLDGGANLFTEALADENITDVEQKISVKERLQKFNRIASESELAAGTGKLSSGRNRRDNTSKQESGQGDYDTSSLSSFGLGFAHMQPRDKEWIVIASQCDYHSLNKMAQECPELVKRKDINGYTALHWAAKHGNADLIKLLAGTYKSDINAKSNGGYTPLHLAAQFSRQNVYDILSQVYNADVNVRDHSGKKPMQYLVRQDTAVSMDTFKKLKEKRRSTEQRERDSSFLRIGSLNVRVKKTTEAFGYFLGKSNSASNIERILHSSWGSADNISNTEVLEKDKDKQIMPPPSGPTVARSASKSNGKRKHRQNFPSNDSITIKEIQSDSDSDTACGFGSDWQN